MPAAGLLAMPAPNHRRLVGRLLLVVAVSFAFGLALVPLYNVFCTVTGLNGKSVGLGGVARAATTPPSRIDLQRIVTVEFTDTVMPGLPWKIEPLSARLELHPGEVHQALYRVSNLSDKAIVGQAVPSISPGLAALNFEKLECFCFRQQTLAPGETKELPLTFIVKPEIDRDIRTITLSYAFYNVTDAKPEVADRAFP